MAKEKKPDAELAAPAAAAALPTPEFPPLNAQEQQEADELWTRHMERFRLKRNTTLHAILDLHWENGQFLASLLKDARKYGNRTVVDFCREQDVSDRLAYSYLHFFQRYSRAQMEDLVRRKISWSAVAELIKVDDATKRKELEDRVSANAISRKELEREVIEAGKAERIAVQQRGEKPDRRGGAHVHVSFKAMGDRCVDLVTRLEDFREQYRVYGKLPDSAESKQKGEAALRIAAKAMRDAHKAMGTVLKALGYEC